MKRKTFGKLLKEASAEAGVSHSELARRMGVTQNRVPAIFASPSLTERTFRRAARALGFDVDVKLVRSK